MHCNWFSFCCFCFCLLAPNGEFRVSAAPSLTRAEETFVWSGSDSGVGWQTITRAAGLHNLDAIDKASFHYSRYQTCQRHPIYTLWTGETRYANCRSEWGHLKIFALTIRKHFGFVCTFLLKVWKFVFLKKSLFFRKISDILPTVLVSVFVISNVFCSIAWLT